MEVKTHSRVYPTPYDPLGHLDFSFANKKDTILWIGSNWGTASGTQPVFKVSGKLNLQLHFEIPNAWMVPAATSRLLHSEAVMDKILTICKSTCDIRNDILGTEKYIYCFFPFSESNIPKSFDKEYDIFYSGHVNAIATRGKSRHGTCSHHVGLISEIILPVLSEFKNTYKLCQVSGKFSTDYISYHQKLSLNARSKISLVYDWLGGIQLNEDQLKRLELYGTWKRDSFGSYCTSQHKARTVEAFFSKSLALVYKDPFKQIENFCVPNKHFIYFEDKDDLQLKCKHILENYQDSYYQDIIEQAYDLAVNSFTTRDFYYRYIRDL